MAVNVTKNDDKTVTLEVTLDGDVWEAARKAAFDRIRRSMNIKGFRKGHVPAAMAKKLVSEAAVNEQAAMDAAQNALISGLDESGVDFVDSPTLEIREAGNDKAVLAFSGEVYPEAKLGQYKGFGLKKEEAAVTDEEVEDVLKKDAEKKADIVVVEEDEPAEEGETVTIDFVGKKDGEPFAGGSAEDYQLKLGSRTFIPGFEEGVAGMKTGETKTLELTFPEDYGNEDLAGKAVTFDVTVKQIEKEVLPEINDDFAASLNIEGVNTVDELKNHVRQQLQAEKDSEAEEKFAAEVLEKAVENAEVDLPSVLVDREVDNMMKMMLQQISQTGLDAATYFKLVNQNPEEFKETLRPEAVQRLKNTFVLDAIVKAEDLNVSDEEIEKEYENFAAMYNMPVEQVKKMVRADMIADDLLREAAMDVLKNNQ